MTTLLKKAIAKAQVLSDSEQDRLASLLLREIEAPSRHSAPNAAELRPATAPPRRQAGTLVWELPDRQDLLDALAPEPNLEADFYDN